MAGHSQFKNIMHRKGAQDKKRAKIFARLSKEITIAAKLGMPDPEHNPRLRSAIIAARAQNMPKSNIDRAVKKSEEKDGANYEEIRYEGYGPGGVAVIVEAMTDNRNRSASEIRTAFSKNGGNLGETGSVSFMFDYLGSIIYDKAKFKDEEEAFEAAIEAGADECELNEDVYQFLTQPDGLHEVAKNLEAKFGEPQSANFTWQPKNTTLVEGEVAEQFIKMMEALEEVDDVQNVYSNVELNEADLNNL